MARSCAYPLHCLFLFSSILFTAQMHASQTEGKAPLVKGLSYSFYSKTCPKLETIVRNHLKKVFKNDNGQAPALLRIFFHDCFVQVISCNNPINFHKLLLFIYNSIPMNHFSTKNNLFFFIRTKNIYVWNSSYIYIQVTNVSSRIEENNQNYKEFGFKNNLIL